MSEAPIGSNEKPVSFPSIVATEHLNQNVETMAAVHARTEENVGHHQRFIEWVTAFVGRPITFYSIIVIVASWIAFNLAEQAWGTARPLDPPPFYWLQGSMALAALLTATMVLTTQNRQAKLAERRAELDLQVNLRAEQKITKIVALLEELRRDLPTVRNREDPVAAAMTRAVDPNAVLSALEETFEGRPAEPGENASGTAHSSR
ncbi:MAG TPA: DUF1003 domain-containing protein [Polyangiaceae bacterium]